MDHAGDVIQRANQRCDIPERTPLDTAFADRAARIPFKVGQHQVSAVDQQMPEMKIAVTTDSLSIGQPRVECGAQACLQFLLPRGDDPGEFDNLRGPMRPGIRDEFLHPSRKIPQR